nr:tripartite tricarboxylate transporter substrate binding protein [Burkholderiaceae bacterium]
MKRRTLLRAGTAGAAIALAQRRASAQAWPARQIRIIVPYAAGGTSDILARLLGVKVGEALGQQIVVENRAGANGALGTDLVAKSPPDGYTLLLTDVSGLTSAPAVVPNLPFNASRDFAPVTLVTYSPHLVVVANQVAAKTLPELIALAKSKKGAMNCAIVGSGSATHIAAAQFAKLAGVEWTYVIYKGGAQALNDVAAGQADVLFNGMLATLPFVQGNRLRALAASSDKRWPTLPDLPTVAENGFPGFLSGSWQGLLAPAGTPPAVIERLNAEFAKALSQPDIIDKLTAQGAEPRPMTAERFKTFLAAETTKWTQVVRDANIK